MKFQPFALAIAVNSFVFGALSLAADRPNVVWIVSEDNSKHYMKLFDEGGASTPNIEKLAKEGLVFDHAFSNAPVCSVARTTLATSVYAPRLFTQFHRKLKTASLPEGWSMFPAYLRRAGYHTTNNSKTDYNCSGGEKPWDASSKKATWRNRPTPDTPFFHMRSFGASHESSLHFKRSSGDTSALATDPADVTLADYHPDTELFRFTYARYHDRIRMVDDFVRSIVAQLEEDDLLDDTFIFYFGDHGGVLPGSKGYIKEAGLHVPLVVYVPKNWRHLVDMPVGSRVDGFVSFIDFGPTVLSLAGVKVPKHMDGRPFLGKDVTSDEVKSRDETFGYADRFDEKYEFCRSLRKGKYKYVRNYQAFLPDGLQNNYRYRMLAYEEWRSLYKAGTLNAAQRQFFERKPVEALYDVEADPHEVKNLANEAAYGEVLTDMRGRLRKKVESLPDLSFYPESVLAEQAYGDPLTFGEEHAQDIALLADTADLALLPFEEAKSGIVVALESKNAWRRYWALNACSCFGEQAVSLVDQAKTHLKDEELLVRLRAAEFLGIVGAADPRPTMVEVLNSTDSAVEALIAFNTVVYFNDHFEGKYPFDLEQLKMRVDGGQTERRIQYLRGLNQ
jgi:arylsulfatase A-like enzyme